MKKEIILFCKEPILGKVKSRLAIDIGDERTLEIYKKLLEHTLDIITRGDINFTIFVAEALETDFFNKYKGRIYIQEGKFFGDRLYNAIKLRLQHSEQIVIIGSDCPELKVEHLLLAHEYLTDNDMVIGPALDGGFYLLGTRSISRQIFKDIVWSSNSVRIQLLQNAHSKGLKTVELDFLTDIDTYEDLNNTGFLAE